MQPTLQNFSDYAEYELVNLIRSYARLWVGVLHTG